MSKLKPIYTCSDVAFIIPTKDRPDKLRALLESLKGQTSQSGKVIVIDGGRSVKRVVEEFADSLSLEYYECDPPGQIRQKNQGVAKLNGAYQLVGFLDDDIVMEPCAVEAMIAFWNRCEPNTAGVSFNIVNVPRHKHSWLKAIMGVSSSEQGRVLRSGYNVAGSPVETDLRAQWLCGGATVWKREIFQRFAHKEISSRWAICEDVIFSYPIGKKFPLYVCADAKVRHEHVYDHKVKMRYRYYGRTITLWRLYFVESHAELSRALFFWMIFGQVVARCVSGFFLLRTRDLEYAIGQIEGAVEGLTALVRGATLLPLLNEEAGSCRE